MARSRQHPKDSTKYQVLVNPEDEPFLRDILLIFKITREKLDEGFDTFSYASNVAAYINDARIKATGH